MIPYPPSSCPSLINQGNLLLQHSIAAYIFESAVMVSDNVIIIIRVYNMQQLTVTCGESIADKAVNCIAIKCKHAKKTPLRCVGC